MKKVGARRSMRDGGKRLIYIGTSGWYYDHWRGPFYPKQLSKKQFLEFYGKHFHTVEINNSFYRLSKKNTLKEWKDKTPSEFKVQRFIFSHKA